MPADQLEAPEQSGKKKTLAFYQETDELKILEAIERWHEGCRATANNVWCNNQQTGAALLYVLGYTGLRISDAIKFEPRQIKRITTKSGTVAWRNSSGSSRLRMTCGLVSGSYRYEILAGPPFFASAAVAVSLSMRMSHKEKTLH